MRHACSLDPSIVRTVPIVVALITSLVMMCLGPPRQMLGFQNVDETCPPIEKQSSMVGDPLPWGLARTQHRALEG